MLGWDENGRARRITAGADQKGPPFVFAQAGRYRAFTMHACQITVSFIAVDCVGEELTRVRSRLEGRAYWASRAIFQAYPVTFNANLECVEWSWSSSPKSTFRNRSPVLRYDLGSGMKVYSVVFVRFCMKWTYAGTLRRVWQTSHSDRRPPYHQSTTRAKTRTEIIQG